MYVLLPHCLFLLPTVSVGTSLSLSILCRAKEKEKSCTHLCIICPVLWSLLFSVKCGYFFTKSSTQLFLSYAGKLFQPVLESVSNKSGLKSLVLTLHFYTALRDAGGLNLHAWSKVALEHRIIWKLLRSWRGKRMFSKHSFQPESLFSVLQEKTNLWLPLFHSWQKLDLRQA